MSPFMIIIRARSPPKVLLGLKLPTSPLLLSLSGVLFLKRGIYRFYNGEDMAELDPIESTYCSN